MAIASFSIPVQSGKVGGAHITLPAAIDGSAGLWKVLFDASQTEEILYQFEMPNNYSSALVVVLTYAMASATADKVDMEAKLMAIADGENVDASSFDTLNEISGGTTVPGTAGFRDTISITMTNADSVAAGETVLLHIQRDHDDGDDTATGDLELVGILVKYTIT